MRLIPPTMSESTKSDGERAVFEALAASAGAGRTAGGGRAGGAAAGPDTAGWTVLHSFDIADHRRRLAGEIDSSVQWTIPDDGRAPAVRYKGPPSPGRYRYAVISSGRITAHESETSRVTRTRAR